MNRLIYSLILIIFVCADITFGFGIIEAGNLTPGYYNSDFLKDTLIRSEENDTLVAGRMNWTVFLNSCIRGERANMMAKGFDHKLKLISYKETDNIDITTRDSMLIRTMTEDFLTPVHLHLNQTNDTFKLIKFTDAYAKSMSEYNKIKKAFIEKYYNKSGDNDLELFNLRWSYDEKFFHTQLFVTNDSKYLYDDLFFYLYRLQNVKAIKSRTGNWEKLLNSIIDGGKSTVLSELFKHQLKLLSYKVTDTIDILTKDSLLIEPITDEILVPVYIPQTSRNNLTLNMLIDLSDSFFHSPGTGMKIKTVSKEVIPKYKLVKASETSIPIAVYQRTKNYIFKVLRKRFGGKYKLIRLTWNYKGQVFHTQAFVSQITNTLTYDIILISLQSIGTKATKIMTKGEITKKMKKMMKEKMPELSSSIKKIRYPEGDGIDTLTGEIMKKTYSRVLGLPNFLRAYITSYTTVLGFWTYDNKNHTNQKYLDKFNLEIQPHSGLFLATSGAKEVKEFKKGTSGFFNYHIDYSFKMNDIPIAFEGTGISRFGVEDGGYGGFISSELLR